MTKPTEHACDSKRIDDYLNERLSNSLQAEFEAHLSGCEQCQQEIQKQAAEPELWGHAVALLGPTSSAAFDESPDDSDSGFRSRQVQSVLDSLAPTDDPEMLGRVDDYEIIGVVGVGGMGAVLKGFDRSLRRVVAIKIMAPHLAGSGSARTRFQREARAAAAITHDNVIDIYGVSEANGLPYLVMPFARGPSLQKRIDEGGPLSVTEVLRIGRQIAAGLTAAHEQGLVHRDIKPANILLNDGIERLLITDFGVARAMDDASMTRTGVIAGTPQYMSPEQARGESVDYRSDLFSLGSILYTACTGRPPFRSEAAYGILRRITDDDPRPIREINPDIPDWLCRIIERLMAKHPADRFQNAAQVTELLDGCLAHLQQPTQTPLPQSIASLAQPHIAAPQQIKPEGNGSAVPRSFRISRTGVSVMISSLLLAGLAFAGVQMTAPADIGGQWKGETWSNVTLSSVDEASDWYMGSFTNAEGQRGALQLEWSRLQRRYNGRWKLGGQQSGSITLRSNGAQGIRGAVSVDPDSPVTPTMASLREFAWTRAATNANQKPLAQTASASNAATATARPQIIESPIKGRIVRWSDGMVENARVKTGDLIVQIQDTDPTWLIRVEDQRNAAKQQVTASEALLATNQRKAESARQIVEASMARAESYKAAKQQVAAAAKAAVASAQNKILAEEQQLNVDQAAFAQLRVDYERLKANYEKNISSEKLFQQAERRYKEAEAKVAKAKSNVQATRSELEVQRNEGKAKESRAQADVGYANGLVVKAESDIAQAASEIVKAQADLTKAKQRLVELQTKVSRQESMQIFAPFDGYITGLTERQLLKEGDQICRITPEGLTTEVPAKRTPEPPMKAQQKQTSAPPQTIETPISGIIRRWGNGIADNAIVKKGDLIVNISEDNSELQSRLEEQIEASKRNSEVIRTQIVALQKQVQAHESNLEAAKKIVASQRTLVETYKASKRQVETAAASAIVGAKNKLKVEQLQVTEQQAFRDQASIDFDRTKASFDKQLISEAKFQLAERKLGEAEAKLEKTKVYVDMANDELTAKQDDETAKSQKAQSEVDYAIALTAKAESETAKATVELSKATVELSKAELELTNEEERVTYSEDKLASMQTFLIKAPFDGRVTNLTKRAVNQAVKEGDQICLLVPKSDTQTVTEAKPKPPATSQPQAKSSPPATSSMTAPEPIVVNQSLTAMFGPVSDLTRRLREGRDQIKLAQAAVESNKRLLSHAAKEQSQLDSQIVLTQKKSESNDIAEAAAAKGQLAELQTLLRESRRTQTRLKREEVTLPTKLETALQNLAEAEVELETVRRLLQSQLAAAVNQLRVQSDLTKIAKAQFETGDGDRPTVLNAQQALAQTDAKIQQLKLLLEMYDNIGKTYRNNDQL